MRNTIKSLRQKAARTRREVLEKVFMTGKGHIGGTFSCVELLIALYYGEILRFKPGNPKWERRDRLVVGKGHACLAFYSIFTDLGMLSRRRLQEVNTDGSTLGGQLNIDTAGVEYNTGSLGNAPGVAAGMALAARLNGNPARVFFLIGDGECDEGAVWESLIFSRRMALDNIVGIIDHNRLSVTAEVQEHDAAGTLAGRVTACGWECREIDGHDFNQIFNALGRPNKPGKPCMIIAHTVKGKGVSSMENSLKWHSAVPGKEDYLKAMRELREET